MKEKVIIHDGFPALIKTERDRIRLFISLKKAQSLQLGKVPEPSVDYGSITVTHEKENHQNY